VTARSKIGNWRQFLYEIFAIKNLGVRWKMSQPFPLATILALPTYPHFFHFFICFWSSCLSCVQVEKHISNVSFFKTDKLRFTLNIMNSFSCFCRWNDGKHLCLLHTFHFILSIMRIRINISSYFILHRVGEYNIFMT
jgi:hypothetical protein